MVINISVGSRCDCGDGVERMDEISSLVVEREPFLNDHHADYSGVPANLVDSLFERPPCTPKTVLEILQYLLQLHDHHDALCRQEDRVLSPLNIDIINWQILSEKSSWTFWSRNYMAVL